MNENKEKGDKKNSNKKQDQNDGNDQNNSLHYNNNDDDTQPAHANISAQVSTVSISALNLPIITTTSPEYSLSDMDRRRSPTLLPILQENVRLKSLNIDQFLPPRKIQSSPVKRRRRFSQDSSSENLSKHLNVSYTKITVWVE